MNCTACNAPLDMNTRFCPQCGQPVSAAGANANPSPQYSPYQPSARNEAPTIQPTYLPGPQMNDSPTLADNSLAQSQQRQPSPESWQQPQPSPESWRQPQPGPQGQPVYYRPGSQEPGTFSNTERGMPRRRRSGCLTRSLITLVVLLLLIVGGWFLVLRPYLNNMALTKLNSVLGAAVDSIPPPVALLPGGHVAISEKLINNLLVLVSSPNGMVSDPRVHFTPSAMRIEFSVDGFPCAVTGVPQANQGHITFTNVNIEGIAWFILSSDDIQTLINRHLADAQAKVNHPVESVQLKEQELDLVIGAPGGLPAGGLPGGLPPFPGGTPPPLPTIP